MHPLHQSVSLIFFIFVKAGFISKSFSKGLKSCLNSNPLSNTTLRGSGYLIIHLLLNNWLTLQNDSSMHSSLPPVTSSMLYVGIPEISHRPVAGLIISMQVRITLFLMIVPPGCCCLIYLVYEPIGYTCTKSHDFMSAILLYSRFP